MTNVVAGAYVISAKTIVEPTGSGADWAVTCTLDAGGGNTDVAEFESTLMDYDNDRPPCDAGHAGHTSLPVDGVDRRSAAGAPTRPTRALTKITAIKVDTVTREAVTG